MQICADSFFNKLTEGLTSKRKYCIECLKISLYFQRRLKGHWSAQWRQDEREVMLHFVISEFWSWFLRMRQKCSMQLDRPSSSTKSSSWVMTSSWKLRWRERFLMILEREKKQIYIFPVYTTACQIRHRSLRNATGITLTQTLIKWECLTFCMSGNLI